MIAIIAGTGDLPLEACKNLLRDQRPFFVVCLFPEQNLAGLQEVIQNRAEIIAQECYRPGKILALLQQKKTSHLLFIGKVDKSNLLKHLKFDWLAIKLLTSLIYKSDKAIMEKLLDVLHQQGIEVIKQDDVLKSLLVPPGILTGKLTPELEQSIQMGIETATAIAHADIGQTVVIKDKMVIAVEAIEGTDACIRRGIQLGGGGVIVCKAARSDQNKKFDLPTLGPASLASIQKGEITAIAWSSSHTLIANLETFIARAKELDITLVSVK
ncbi:UDP-2,3-diacylglucosamine diphosphatase LpxI [Candidatus Dependentiae bacterium]|nr:UDP-2,3-diacylglucosamine diphosphatase LpxI [Candidatus Dependentiae bacterium]